MKCWRDCERDARNALSSIALSSEEALDDWRDFMRPRHEEQVTAVADVQLRLRNERGQNPGVEGGNGSAKKRSCGTLQLRDSAVAGL
jgi:hypothetical protein